MGWDGMGWDGMRWDGMGWDGDGDGELDGVGGDDRGGSGLGPHAVGQPQLLLLLQDPERRRILEKLAKKGMSFGGGSSMDTEQLRNMEKMMDGLGGGGGFGGGAGGGFGGGGGDAAEEPAFRSAPDSEDDVPDEDKMEL